VDDHGTLHLEYLPNSHSLLVGLGLGVLLWAAAQDVPPTADRGGVRVGRRQPHRARRPPVGAQHPARPWLAHPLLGLNLQANPWLDFAIETAMCIGCWAYYRGGGKLLAAILVLNLLNLPLMFAGEGGASPMAHAPFILPTTILITIGLAWAVIHRYARRTRQTADAVSPAGVPAEVTA
jgi:hypothetical protein